MYLMESRAKDESIRLLKAETEMGERALLMYSTYSNAAHVFYVFKVQSDAVSSWWKTRRKLGKKRGEFPVFQVDTRSAGPCINVSPNTTQVKL